MKFDKKTAEDIFNEKLYGEILKNGKPIEITTTDNCDLVVGYEDIDGVMTPFIFNANDCPEITMEVKEFPTFEVGDVIVNDGSISIISKNLQNGQLETYIVLDNTQEDSWIDYYYPTIINTNMDTRKAIQDEINNLKLRLEKKVNYLTELINKYL